MLMRRTRAYSSSCSQQVVLVYLYPFRHNSLLKSVLQSKIVKNSLKAQDYLGSSKSSMLTFLRSLSSVVVMISSMSVPVSYTHLTLPTNREV